jgi:NDP-sugar pyrophosphorylase family protein
MLKVIIPIAGTSELFNPSEYFYPKPLIEINGKPMIEVVLENIMSFSQPFDIIFIIKDQDAKKFYLENTLKILAKNANIITLKKETKGALCSVLMSIDLVQDEDEILILNGDQIIDANFDDIYQFWNESKSDGGLVTFNSVHPRWSYVKSEEGKVTETAEKNPISNHAIAGYYYVKSAKDFFEAAFSVILNENQINGAYFISSIYNEMILKGKKINIYPIAPNQYHSFYSPEKIKNYELQTRR